LQKLRPGIDGVVLEINGRRSTFLPQVWEELTDPVEFLNHLSRKGGSASDAWRGPGRHRAHLPAEAFAEPAGAR
jgi:AMMECR1 domain-containing protein